MSNEAADHGGGMSERVWAPFGAQNATVGPNGRRRATQTAFYDHGYRQPGEHYHHSFEELLDCPLLGDEPHLRESRATRAKEQAKRAARKASPL